MKKNKENVDIILPNYNSEDFLEKNNKKYYSAKFC